MSEQNKDLKVFEELVAGFTSVERTSFDENNARVIAGSKASIETGDSLLVIQTLLAKPGKQGGFSGYLRSRGIVRETAYRLMAEAKWFRLPADFKKLADEHALDSGVRQTILRCHRSEQTIAETSLKVADYLKENPPVDPVKKAIESAVKTILGALKGNLEAVEAMAANPDLFQEGMAQEGLLRVQNRLVAAGNNAVAQLITAWQKTVSERKKLAEIKLPALPSIDPSLPEPVQVVPPRLSA
jgi:hypothetical protein